MSMNGTQLGNEIWNAIKPYIEWKDDETPPDTLSGAEIWRIIGQKIVAHIQNNAKATGNDSDGDTHNLDIT